MEESKPFWQSKTIWANIATMAVGLGVAMGWFSEAQGDVIASSFPELIVGAIGVVTGAVGTWGRIVATKKLTT